MADISTDLWSKVGSQWSRVSASSIVEVVTDACRKDPDRPALIFEDGLTVTRADFLDRIERFASYVQGLIKPGDRIAIMLGNRAEFMVGWIAVVANRGVLVLMNPALQVSDAAHVLKDSEAVAVITDQAGRGLIDAIRSECPALKDVIRVEENEPDGLESYDTGSRFRLDEAQCERTDTVNIYYTSGTTGRPKGCMVGHDYWLRFIDLYLRIYGLGRDDRILCCLQFFYNDPCWQFLTSLHAGTTLVVMRRFSVSRFWDVVEANGITQLFGIASIPSLLLKSPPTDSETRHRVKFAVQCGVPTNSHQDLVQRWGVPWVEIYGLTETGMVVTMPLEFGKEMTGSGSIGLPCPEVRAQIVDDNGVEVPLGEPGEIVFDARTAGLMHGYLNRPEETAELMRGGWLHTGDLGRMDARGFLYFMGRKKDIVRRSGENIAAAEVEQVLRSHPMVLEAAIIPVPDEIRGEEVKAYIQLAAGVNPSQLDPAVLVEFCATKLARYKVPRYVQYRMTDFERTPSMRVQKDELKKEPDLIAGAWDRQVELGW